MSITPLSRTDDLLTEELDDELLVYDEQQNIACRLNPTAALVWRSANGERTVEDLVALVREEVTELADADLVMVALDQLETHGLLASGYKIRDPDEVRLSRRRFIRRVGVVGTAAMALPVVQSVVAPTLAAAQSAGNCDACICPCGCTSCLTCASCTPNACGPCSPTYCQPPGGCDCGSCICATCGAGVAPGAARPFGK
jgi:hypothetical protein